MVRKLPTVRSELALGQVLRINEREGAREREIDR